MRLVWYAGASTALAATVIASAFHQRSNFYSAMVHLAQSSLSLMILVNLVFLIYGSFMYGLQRLCFGQLRPVEIEQLYEKAWFAVTETCLAMTIFREEVGAFFLVMFTALVTGKVWGWIGEGRVEVLEQQPPTNPRLFHTRLSVSLLLSIVYDCCLLHYSISAVVQQARPSMMVMFLFEFAVLTISSFQTAFRYGISLVEARVVKLQTAKRMEERRRQIREQRAEILRRRETEGATRDGEAAEPLPNEEDIDEMDIEVAGWEAKGQWILTLDLIADFLKLGIYSAFFCVLFMFYGLPIHIMRDLFMTTRSFIKRLGALLRYIQAVREMNKYPDATVEELSREDTCIICREEMRPWDPANPGQVERTRPKKLPCGHILHYGCLKSWLERQQACPTCRSSVVDGPPRARGREAMVFRFGLNFPGGQNQQPPANGGAVGAQNAQGAQGAQGGQNGPRNNRNGGMRMFNLGPIRLGIARGGVQDLQGMAQRMPAEAENRTRMRHQQRREAREAREARGEATTTDLLTNIRNQLAEANQSIAQATRRLQRDTSSLNQAEIQFQTLDAQLQELMRLSLAVPQNQQLTQQVPQQQTAISGSPSPTAQGQAQQLQSQPQPQQQPPQPQHIPVVQLHGPQLQGTVRGTLQAMQPFPQPFQQLPGQYAHSALTQTFNPFATRLNYPIVARHGGAAYSTAIPAGSPDLPEGVVIPPGWSLLPLQRLDGGITDTVAAATADLSQLNGNSEAALQTQFPVPSQTVPLRAGSLADRVQDSLNAANGSASTRSNASDVSARSSSQEPVRSAEQQNNKPNVQATPSSSSDLPRVSTSEPPTVTAPTPVMPRWGGSRQLFGGGGATAFGYQPQPPFPSTTPVPQEETVENANDGGPTMTSPQVQVGGSSVNNDKGKGKARAVTVEEASDDESD